jgi:putative chitinase
MATSRTTGLVDMQRLSSIIPAAFFLPVTQGCRQRGFNATQTAHFISQTMHESAGYTVLVENLNYSAAGLLRTWPSRFTQAQATAMARKPEQIANHVYGKRLGNTLPDDGWRFRGRGIIQVTGRANYRNCSEALFKDMRLLQNPDILLIPEHAVASAFWYWDRNRLQNVVGVETLTRRINGGLNGLADRQRRFNQIIKLLS